MNTVANNNANDNKFRRSNYHNRGYYEDEDEEIDSSMHVEKSENTVKNISLSIRANILKPFFIGAAGAFGMSVGMVSPLHFSLPHLLSTVIVFTVSTWAQDIICSIFYRDISNGRPHFE